MLRLGLTFDMKRPHFATTSIAEQYEAMLDLVEYADARGFYALMFNEHHSADNNYLPSSLVATAAAAARTKHLRLRPLVATSFYEPVKLAEDMAVIDQISGGRLEPVLGTGYRSIEFEMFGVELEDRRAKLEETIHVLRQAWTGEPFEYRGRTVRVMPQPVREAGPPIFLAGMSKAAARRAARLADGFFPVSDHWWDVYRGECITAGKPDPGSAPPHGGPMFLHVTEDPERDWNELAPYLLHAIETYREWTKKDAANFGPVPPQFLIFNETELRASAQWRVVTPDECVELMDSYDPDASVIMRPMWGGYNPDLARSSLKLFIENVLPRTTHGALPAHPDLVSSR